MSEQPFLDNALLFTRALKAAGLPITPTQAADFCQGLTLIDIGRREQVFHAARSLLVTHREHLALFETLFNLYWRSAAWGAGGHGQKMPVAPRHNRPREHRATLAALMAARARPADPELDLTDRSASYSGVELLQRKDFGAMTPEELETIKRLMEAMRWRVSLRRTRRLVVDPKGARLHLRRCLRSAGQTGGVPLRLSWQSPKIKQRPLVLLADISGSMEKYARLVLQFFYCVSHSLRGVETFVFGTRLTRITPALKLKNIDQAINQAAREVIDWSGGTRIGDSLQQFNRQWSRRVLRRGSIVIVISDGWERGDVSRLAEGMRFLQRRCHRLIWLNPLSGQAGYTPRVEGMAAALPFIDDFLPIHNFQSLTALADHLASLGHHHPTRGAAVPIR